MRDIEHRYQFQDPFNDQVGAVLLVLTLLLIVGSSYILIKKINANHSRDISSTILALNTAKDALMSYAITYPDRSPRGPGYLPCPDQNRDGTAEGSCSLSGPRPTTGWLPFKTLELSELQDDGGARLWYAVSGQYRSFLDPPLNSGTPGDFIVDSDLNDIVAVIIAPGEVLGNQHRTITKNTDDTVHNAKNDVRHYLEGSNKEPDNRFVTTLGGIKRGASEYDIGGTSVFNDRIVFITRRELMVHVEKRVLGTVKQKLVTYQQSENRYPWLAAFADPSTSTIEPGADDTEPNCSLSGTSTPTFYAEVDTYEGHIPLCDTAGTPIGLGLPPWFIKNQWHHLVYIAYAREAMPGGAVPCDGNNCLLLNGAGLLNGNIRALAIIAGPALATENRHSDDLTDYFEAENATPADNVFWQGAVTDTFNDQITVVARKP